MGWRWAGASQIGTSHLKYGTRKQDAFRAFTTGNDAGILCVIVCDGAGSATYGGQGASLICRHFATALRSSSKLPDENQVREWVDQIRDRLAAVAERREVGRKAFASTMLLLVASPDRTLIAHVGDGAIVGRRDGEWTALSSPENGEYASTTYFLTDDPAPRLRIACLEESFDTLAVFTDGIEDLALGQPNGHPHEPFFRTMSGPVLGLRIDGPSKELSRALGAFLAGERVCSKTDDDKTLVIATRE